MSPGGSPSLNLTMQGVVMSPRAGDPRLRDNVPIKLILRTGIEGYDDGVLFDGNVSVGRGMYAARFDLICAGSTSRRLGGEIDDDIRA